MQNQKDRVRSTIASFILLLAAVVSWLAGKEILHTVQLSTTVFSGNVSQRAVAWVIFILMNAALLLGLGLAAWGKGPLAAGAALFTRIVRLRSRFNWAGWILAGILAVAPAILILYFPSDPPIGDGWLRLWLLGATAAGFAALATRSQHELAGWLPFLAGLMVVAVVFSAIRALTRVTDYPFSIGWSEGNRFYDYSLIFGRSLYTSQHPIDLTYYSPGRYALWGILFLFPGLPISIHRLWDALLWTLTPLLFGWLLMPELRRGWRAGLALWVALFLYQGPIYPMLLIAAILLVLAFRSQWIWKWLGTAAGSLYAGLSRWTWFAAVGVWGAILEQLFRPNRGRSLVRRYLPAFLIFVTGALPGLVANAPRWLTPKESTLSFSQPLLWYRLFPNSTFPPGVLLALVIAVVPLVGLLVWMAITRRWQMDWSQQVMVVGASTAFLVAGLVASTKIGGGSNLHNLDMFFITLVFLLLAALREQAADGRLPIPRWPRLLHAWVTVGVFVPVWMIFSQGGPLILPPAKLAQEYLVDIQQAVDVACPKGEILFVDQRQLLSFGLVQGVDLVSDYEKKYMMDQAMAGNAVYFQKFYQDLENHRFSLIITEPLFLVQQGEEYSFGEENDAFVKWVSRPLLCYYEVMDTLTEVRVQYLVPRSMPPDEESCLLPD